MTKVKFFIGHIFWGFIAFVWYRSIFRCIGGYSLIQSRLILCGILVLISLASSLLIVQKARNGFSVFLNLVSGYGLYTVFTYIQIRKGLIGILLIAAAVLSAPCVLCVMGRRIKNKKRIKIIMIRRLQSSMLFIQTAFSFSMTVLILIIGINGLFGNPVLQSKSDAVDQSNIEEYTIANKIETVALLEESRWRGLSVQERIDVLQVVANIEQRYLGLPDKLNVGAENLREGVLGYYEDEAHRIIIDMDSLLNDSPEELLNAIAHEAFHSYEYRMVDAYLAADDSTKKLRFYRRVISYMEEFNNYIDDEEDSYLYYTQKCEEDAREYAAEAVEDYCEKINAYYGAEVMSAVSDSFWN